MALSEACEFMKDGESSPGTLLKRHGKTIRLVCDGAGVPRFVGTDMCQQ